MLLWSTKFKADKHFLNRTAASAFNGDSIEQEYDFEISNRCDWMNETQSFLEKKNVLQDSIVGAGSGMRAENIFGTEHDSATSVLCRNRETSTADKQS